MGTDVSLKQQLCYKKKMLELVKLNSVPGWHVPDHLTVCHLYFSADELLQEQKADMDQFLSSISESQPDVTVSSEESVEVPVSEGKPYRPFQVTSLGSRSMPEGKEFQPKTQSHAALRTISYTHQSIWMSEKTRQNCFRERVNRFTICFMPIQMCCGAMGLELSVLVPCGLVFNVVLGKFR